MEIGIYGYNLPGIMTLLAFQRFLLNIAIAMISIGDQEITEKLPMDMFTLLENTIKIFEIFAEAQLLHCGGRELFICLISAGV